MNAPSAVVIIPARGGSKGIARKNLRSLRGHPLIAYAIGTALRSRYRPDVVVSSDDAEILATARRLGAHAHRRHDGLAGDGVTLDAAVCASYPEIAAALGREHDIVVTFQPTSPLVRAATLDAVIDRLAADPELDTVQTAIDDTHLTWTRRDGRFVPLYRERVNRQFLEPIYRETGGLIACRRALLLSGSRFGPRVELELVEGAEAIDIDTRDDWALAEYYLAHRDILFLVAGYPAIGLGHVHNALSIANELVRHRTRFLVGPESDLAASVLSAHHYEVLRPAGDDLVAEAIAFAPDAVISDRLDTEALDTARFHEAGIKVISFEDLGEGAREADLVVNAIYPDAPPRPGHHIGPGFFLARPEFRQVDPRAVAERVARVLVTFGGVDPGDLTHRTVAAISGPAAERGIAIDVILGRGYDRDLDLREVPGVTIIGTVPDMAERIRDADLVFTSAGRTVFEIACLGTPAIVLAQNEREMTHTFASEENGFVHLGLGRDVADATIAQAFIDLVDNGEERASMQRRMLREDLRGGTARVVRLIEEVLERS
ncbi:MAG: acylneuraminate cytidylyltransferase [Chloroflexota bacterium]|nr:acylneuraminate cytidylyltransferase [Chloroflexota bacterium]